MIVYVLYNFRDSPEEFLEKMRDLMEWGVVAYPMRFEPLNFVKKNHYVGPKWTAEQLEMAAHARRVICYGGAFPLHEGLRRKFHGARSLEEALSLRPVKHTSCKL